MNKCDISDIETIIKELNNNKIIAIPTDTIYGLCTNLKNGQKIIDLKKRNNKPLAILCSSVLEMKSIIEIDDKFNDFLNKYTPGALTIVGVTKDKKFNINNGFDTTGVRIPNHKSLLNLLKKTGPLIVSSANISGGYETYSCKEVYEIFQNNVDLYVLNDQKLSKCASSVIDVNNNIVYRKGDNFDEIIKDLENIY